MTHLILLATLGGIFAGTLVNALSALLGLNVRLPGSLAAAAATAAR